MNDKAHLSANWRTGLYFLFAVTVLNYVAQIPYYMHFYGVHHVAPSALGMTLLALTFALFLAGYIYTLRGHRFGGRILFAFLVLEFGFYLLHNVSGAFLNDLPVGDPLFQIVSLIGYLNTIVALVYLILMLRDRAYFLA